LAAAQTIIVTGASSGIGRAIALHLSEQGHDVVGTSRGASGLERLDVTDETSCAALIERVLARTGRIDALVNNVGQAMLGAQEECSVDEVRALFEVNVFGAMRMTGAACQAQVRQGLGPRGSQARNSGPGAARRGGGVKGSRKPMRAEDNP
jgi:NAD(P)-dependent dehydrogenase (short-subunit alcohol dehydrogenase family)